MKNTCAALIADVLTKYASADGATTKEQNTKLTACYYRNNPDGTVRWVWPCALETPLFLRMYNTATPKAKFLAVIIRFLFRFKLQRLLASGKINVPVSFTQNDWALFSGTAGVHRTAVLYCNGEFCKIPAGAEAASLPETEFHTLRRMRKIPFKVIEVPRASFYNNILTQEDIKADGKQVAILTGLHWKALTELSHQNRAMRTISKLPGWAILDVQLAALQHFAGNRVPVGMIRKLQQLKNSIDATRIIPVSLVHGDFTPWNMFVKKDKLALIDWEMAKPDMPVLFDAFHFLYQQAALVNHSSFDQLLTQIQEAMEQPEASEIINNIKPDIQLHHQLYLLFTAVHYLGVYARQQHWHPQVYMSIAIWNDALNHLLPQQTTITPRALLVLDVFDRLQPVKYAALKWMANDPATLSEDSDIDLCISRKDTAGLAKWLRRHPLVKRINLRNKSFMCNMLVMLKDETILSLDCIYRFKRKAMVMMDAEAVRHTSTPNSFGVKLPEVGLDFTYTWLFYLLNHSNVPKKYQEHFSFRSREWSIRLNKSFAWNKILQTRSYTQVYAYNPHIHHKVIKELSQHKDNQGRTALKNRLGYYLDTLKQNFFRRGFTITFSGVDGAGKSTIIENVKTHIEKRFRRKVVVLRHRPSILPMLSAWMGGGRAAAEQKAASVLPRQGTNKSLLSSLLRFGYYYTDYLLGQFVIGVKYLCRGYVVLYDRYYFDFIHDSKRSNIHLPVSLVKWGYHLLLKPRFNFFLYANEHVILQRKKELDAPTIRELTKNYRNLFRRLNKKHKHSKYVAIENKTIGQTINIIHQYVKRAAVS